jgi:RNase P/RNase MRP subunit p29
MSQRIVPVFITVLSLLLAGCFDGSSSSPASNDQPPTTPEVDPPATTVSVPVQVVDENGFAIASARIEVDGELAATTDTEGLATIDLSTGAARAVRAEAEDHLGQTRQIEPLADSASNANLRKFALKRREDAVVLVAAENGGSVEGVDGVTLELPAGALVTPSGQPVTGAVDVFMSPVDISDERERRAFPGEFRAVDDSDESVFLVSFGASDYSFEQNGTALSLADGQTANIEIPIYVPNDEQGVLLTAGRTIDLWFLNEDTGIWAQEGFGTVVDAPASPSGLALRAEVTHFSWWNADKPTPPARLNLRVSCGTIGTDCEAPFTDTQIDVSVASDAENQPFISLSSTFDVPASASTVLSGEIPSDIALRVSVSGGGGAWGGEVTPATVEESRGDTATIDIVLRPIREIDGAFAPGNQLRGFMSSVGEEHDYRFTGEADETFAILAFAAENVNSPSNETTGELGGRVTLLDDQGDTLATQVFDAFQSVRIVQTLPETGDYTLRFSAEGKVPGWYAAQTNLLPPGLYGIYLTGSGRSRGRRVDATDNAIVVSRNGFTSSLPTHVIVYEFNAAEGGWRSTFEQKKDTDAAQFGESVAIDGDTVLAGAPGDTLTLDNLFCNEFSSEFEGDRKGVTYVFRRQSDGTGWRLEDCLRRADSGAIAFGTRVALDENVAVVGAPNDANSLPGISPDDSSANSSLEDSGAVYVYARDGSDNWTLEAYIKAAIPARDSGFGAHGLAFDGSHLVVSSDAGTAEDGSSIPPRVHLFERSAGVWSAAGVFDVPGGRLADSAAVDGAIAAAGSSFANKVFTFGRDGVGAWVDSTTVDSVSGLVSGSFGISIDLDGNELLVGAPRETSGGNARAGASYVLRQQPDGQWLLEDTLTADFPDFADAYGTSVVFGSRFIAVGAPDDDGCFLDPESNSCPNSGGVYVTPR